MLIFYRVNDLSIKAIGKALEEYQGWSRLEKDQLMSMLNYVEGKLTFKYLSVPMVASKLTYEDCKSWIDKIMRRISSWKSEFLVWEENSTNQVHLV